MRLAEQHQDWALGFLDEGWWSRFAQPSLHSWAPQGAPRRLIQRSKKKDAPEPKALSGSGVLLSETGGEASSDAAEMLVRFVKGRPVSPVTTRFLAWVCERLAARGKRVWALIWDNASWPISQEVRGWIKPYNAKAKRDGGVRIIAGQLPTRRPWLNPIEPTSPHGKRAICEPDGALNAEDVMDRVCAHYGRKRLPPIEQKTT